MTEVAVLERITHVTPLGVRFLDAATGGFVTWGLSVEVSPRGEAERRTRGLANRFGVFVFHNLPGLRAIEHGRGDAAFWAGQTPRYPFVLAVNDVESRFLPFTLDINLPVRRLFGLPLTSPLSSPLASDPTSLPLFPSPSRQVPDGMGGLCAEIVDSVNGEPAAWALLQAKGPGQPVATGLADALGRVMVLLPYPKTVETLGSPGAPRLPLTGQTWTVDFTVRYRRRVPSRPVADLAEVLAQPAATSWQDTARTIQWTQATLQFGRDLVLASLTGAGTPSPTLLITPAGSPP